MNKKLKVPQPFTIPVEFKPMQGLGGGFRAEWVTADWKGIQAGLDSGAGFGNACFTFWLEKKGKRQYYTADISEVLRASIVKATA